MKTFASLFSGGGGADIGARNAGLQLIWGIEVDPKIAEVYATNLGHRPIVKSIKDVNPYSLEKPDVLWASPPCQQWSNLRSKKLPPRVDGDVGRSIIPFVDILQPSVFFLENVVGYKHAQVFEDIVDALHQLGYKTSSKVVNTADFGVPQTRQRLILRAVKVAEIGFVPMFDWELSQNSNACKHQFVEEFPLPITQEWVGWYSAIADLIPTLPETNFAPWQRKYVKELTETTLVQRVGTRNKPRMRNIYQPAWTIRALGHDRHWRQMDALIAPGQVVKITPLALARLQSFPDSYQLPDSKVLATHIIGNAVPPLLAQKLLELIA